MNRYKIIDKIGNGTYGVVYRALDTKTQEIVALKVFEDTDEEEGIKLDVLRECNTLMICKHENIIQLKEIVCKSSSVIAVLEYLPLTLKEYLEKHYAYIAPGVIKHILRQIIAAAVYLKQNCLMHRDLKTENILISLKNKNDEVPLVKLIDFGLNRQFIPGAPGKYTDTVQTLWYKCPEILLGAREYDFSVDMWSIGCIFAELALGYPLFQGNSEIDQLFKIFKLLGTPTEKEWESVSRLEHYKLTFPNWEKDTENINKMFKTHLGDLGIDLLLKLLRYDPKTRITPEDALQHEYFL